MSNQPNSMDEYHHYLAQSRRIRRLKRTMLNKWRKTRKTRNGNAWMFQVTWVKLLEQSSTYTPDMECADRLSKLASFFVSIPVILPAPENPACNLDELRSELMNAVTFAPLSFKQRWEMQAKITELFGGA